MFFINEKSLESLSINVLNIDDEILIIVEKSVELVESGNQTFCWRIVMITKTVVKKKKKRNLKKRRYHE